MNSKTNRKVPWLMRNAKQGDSAGKEKFGRILSSHSLAKQTLRGYERIYTYLQSPLRETVRRNKLSKNL